MSGARSFIMAMALNGVWNYFYGSSTRPLSMPVIKILLGDTF